MRAESSYEEHITCHRGDPGQLRRWRWGAGRDTWAGSAAVAHEAWLCECACGREGTGMEVVVPLVFIVALMILVVLVGLPMVVTVTMRGCWWLRLSW